MTHAVCVKLAPVLTAERWDDPTWTRPGRDLYWSGSLRLLPGKPTPIVRDHDMDEVLGTVTELATMPFTDGLWIVARGVVDDPPPGCGSTRRRHRSATGRFTRRRTPTAASASPP